MKEDFSEADRAKWADLDRLHENVDELMRESNESMRRQIDEYQRRELSREPEIRISVTTLLVWIFWILPAIGIVGLLVFLTIEGLT